ncbi:MAG: hypothetical protein CL756_04270 [Chloroflexi bacterium]|nr:hypothetical protein [Chloroflexota bacterium]MBB37959.1 hypothetical protein [Actinomycetota bacterium]|tara:strand:- start:360 stop:584 length:225 start_codon:yes stop_codon:yes gene_type:complete
MTNEKLQTIADEISEWPDDKEPIAQDILNAYKFIYRLLDPEGFGFAVTAEVRDCAREVLGMPKVEQQLYMPKDE